MRNAIDCDTDSDVEILSDRDVEIVSDSEDDMQYLAGNVADILKRENPSLQYVTGMGCAAHSLQIAIKRRLIQTAYSEMPKCGENLAQTEYYS